VAISLNNFLYIPVADPEFGCGGICKKYVE